MRRLGDNPTDEELRVMVAEVDEVDLFCDVYNVTSSSVSVFSCPVTLQAL
jgi:hypothetical protein